MQKKRERFYVEEAAKLLGKAWSLADGKNSDFLVTEGTQQFGLEVTQIFTGPQSRAGSAIKEIESNIQRSVDAHRRKFEKITNTPLAVKLLGDMRPDNMATVVRALVAENLASKPIGHHVVIDAAEGLRAYVTRTFRADWFSVNDRVGWVNRNPTTRIADAIKIKSKKLPRYRETAGRDIRLLIVADRIYNSGKLMLEARPMLNLRGFQVVYFFSYPESITVFDSAAPTEHWRIFALIARTFAMAADKVTSLVRWHKNSIRRIIREEN